MDTSQLYSFSFPTDVRFGAGAVKELSAYLKKNNLSAPLVATDANVADLDFFKSIIEDLRNASLRPTIFSEIHPNPVKSDVILGVERYEAASCDSIIGIGGGAGMDVARAIALGINNKRDLFDYDDLIGGDKYVTEPIPHFITIPTTAGTGSEVGRSAIISEDETKKKRILFHPTLLAKMVYADPELTFGLPANITAATGMDALTHNMEAYLAKGFNPLCEGIALEGMRLIMESLETATNNPDEESRAKMLVASLMGAIAFQKGLGIVHSLAHPLSSLVDMHHGLANAICISRGLEFNIPGQEVKFSKMAQVMELENQSPEGVINALNELKSAVGIPDDLGSQGIVSDHIEELSDLAINDFCHPNNPIAVKREDFKRIYESLL
ncbi:MAG TPA: iron-containing alcohol dehydrogenase [Flavobacteriales bacterium]|nr:iron-containing alcohol dehydrogenase [Flavobacteriales bacterium]